MSNTDDVGSPSGSFHSLKEEDSISLYSNDSVSLDDGAQSPYSAGHKSATPDTISLDLVRIIWQ